jgi:hypothetical protein
LQITGAATTREAIVMAVVEYNRRRRMAALAEHGGQRKSMVTPEQLQTQRRKGLSGVILVDGSSRSEGRGGVPCPARVAGITRLAANFSCRIPRRGAARLDAP